MPLNYYYYETRNLNINKINTKPKEHYHIEILIYLGNFTIRHWCI